MAKGKRSLSSKAALKAEVSFLKRAKLVAALYDAASAPRSAWTIRGLARKHGVSHQTFNRFYQQLRACPSTIERIDDIVSFLDALKDTSARPGATPSLTKEEECVIADAITSFDNKGTPLSRECILDLAQVFVQRLPESRRREVENSAKFKDGRPSEGRPSLPFNQCLESKHWLNGFLKRQGDKFDKVRRQALESARHDAMTPSNVAKHFARVAEAMDRLKIRDPRYVFNCDESGVNVEKVAGGKAKAIVQKGTRGNQRQLCWRGSTDHVTIMPVVNAAGQLFNPIVVLPGKSVPYRKLAGGEAQAIHKMLPPGAHLFMGPVAGVDTDIFYNWCTSFVEETVFLRTGGQKLLLILDGYAGHLQYKSLQVLKDNGVEVIAMPAHTSHALQPLDVSVFGPFKEHLRKHMLNRTILSDKNTRNDVWTICEIVTLAYYDAITPNNIRAGFDRAGIWNKARGGVDITKISATDYTSTDTSASDKEVLSSRRSRRSEQAEGPVATTQKLVDEYQKTGRVFASDGIVEVEGRVRLTTAAGAHVTSDAALDYLKRRDEGKEAKEAAALAAAQKKIDNQRERIRTEERERMLTEETGLSTRERAEEKRLRKAELREWRNMSMKQRIRFRDQVERRMVANKTRLARRKKSAARTRAQALARDQATSTS